MKVWQIVKVQLNGGLVLEMKLLTSLNLDEMPIMQISKN